MPQRRQVPIRTCVLCGIKRSKRELIRIVRSSDGTVRVDDSGRLNGRGCYICPNVSNLDAQRINDKIKRALRLEGAIPVDFIEQIKDN